MADEPAIKVTVDGREIRVSWWEHVKEPMLTLGSHEFTISLAKWPAYRDEVDRAIEHFLALPSAEEPSRG